MNDETLPLSAHERAFANDLANPDFSLSVPGVAKRSIARLLDTIAALEAEVERLRSTDAERPDAPR